MVDLVRKFPVYFSALPGLKKEHGARYNRADNLAFQIGSKVVVNDRMIHDKGFALYDNHFDHNARLNLLGFGYEFGEVFRGIQDGKMDAEILGMRAVLRVYDKIVDEAKKREMPLYIVDIPEQGKPDMLYAFNTEDVSIDRLAVAFPVKIPLKESVDRLVAFHSEVIRPILGLSRFDYFHAPEAIDEVVLDAKGYGNEES